MIHLCDSWQSVTCNYHHQQVIDNTFLIQQGKNYYGISRIGVNQSRETCVSRQNEHRYYVLTTWTYLADYLVEKGDFWTTVLKTLLLTWNRHAWKPICLCSSWLHMLHDFECKCSILHFCLLLNDIIFYETWRNKQDKTIEITSGDVRLVIFNTYLKLLFIKMNLHHIHSISIRVNK